MGEDTVEFFFRTREEPERGRVGALNDLHSLLTEHGKRYASGDPQERRRAIVESLQDVQTFLLSQGFTNATTAPINHVLLTLLDGIRGGRADPIFQPRRRKEGGAPKLSMQRMFADGTLAALTELWLRAHANGEGSQRTKLAAASRAMRGRWFRGTKPSRLKQALEDARSESAEHPTRSHYLHLLEHWGRSGIDPMHAFNGLAAVCNEDGSEANYGEN